MAAVVVDINDNSDAAPTNLDLKSKSDPQFNVQKLVDMFTKLNPLAEEFFPSHVAQIGYCDASADNLGLINPDQFPNYRRRRNGYQGRRTGNGRASMAQREDGIRRTVYVSDIDQHITEERLAGLFSNCGPVVDCRVCGDPNSVLRFAFVEFADEHGARAALSLCGTVLGYYPLRVLPSKTAILPVNPIFLPRSEDERDMCSRTVYCTNIDKKITQAEVKQFFESSCGEVSRLRLLGDHVHSTRIAFVEFVLADSATAALSCSGMRLGSQLIRYGTPNTHKVIEFEGP